MYSEMLRKTKNIETSIKDHKRHVEFLETFVSRLLREIDIYQERIDCLILRGDLLDDEVRWRIEAYAERIVSNYNQIREERKSINEHLKYVDILKSQREELLIKMKRYAGLETTRELDLFDYQLIIERNGFIYGTKL